MVEHNLRRRPLYPTELRGRIQKLFTFTGLQDSNDSIFRGEADLPVPDWNAEQVVYPYLHGYTLLEEKGTPPLYPFGFGLSYTRFSVEVLSVRWEDGQIAAVVSVENTGSRAGAQVVQLYIGAPDSAVPRPARLQ